MKRRVVIAKAVLLVGIAAAVAAAMGGWGRAGTQSAFHMDPAWSPNGKQIAFVDRGDTVTVPGDLYVMNANGSSVRKLTQSVYTYQGSEFGAGSPSWSPDGRAIAFRYGYEGIAVINSDGSGFHRILSSGETPAWSPGGRKIAYSNPKNETSGGRIFVANPDGSHAELVAKPDDIHSFTGPTWSPDGQRLAFAVEAAPDTGVATSGYIGIISRYRGKITRVAVGSGPATVDWSPNGRQLVFADWSGTGREAKVTVLDLRTNTRRKIHTGRSPQWSPDGKRIAFVFHGQVWVMNADGSHAHQLTN